MFLETVTRGLAGVSWAYATAANKITAVKSFIAVLSKEIWIIIARKTADRDDRAVTSGLPAVL
jgi:hypothetical protein